MKKFALCFPLFWATLVYSQNGNGSFFRCNATHTGVYSAEKYSSFGGLKWKFKTGGRIFGSPALCNGTAFIGSEDKSLYAIAIANNRLLWKFGTGGAITSTPAVFGNVVYFASYDGFFYAVDAVSGSLRWKFKTNGEKRMGAKGLWTMKPVNEYMEDLFDFFLSSPVIDKKEGIVYFGSGDGSVYALHAGNGTLAWKFATGGIVHTSPAIYNGKLYIGSWDRYFYALDAKTGKEKWKFKTGVDTVYHLLEGIQSSATISDRMVYFGSRDGYYYALDAETGQLVWKYSARNSWILTTGAVKDNTIYIGTSDTYQLVALDARSGKEKYHVQASGYIYSSPSIAGNTAYFGDFTGQMFAVDLKAGGKIGHVYATPGRKANAANLLNKGKLDFGYVVKGMDLSYYSATVAGMKKLYLLGPILSSPVVSDGSLYFGSGDSCLYAVRLK